MEKEVKMVVTFSPPFGWQCFSYNSTDTDTAREFYKDQTSRWFNHYRNATDASWKEDCRRCFMESNRRRKTICVMTQDEFTKKHDDFYLSQPPVEITEDEYDYALNVLPPLRMFGNWFHMREFMSATITQEFYKEGGKFYWHYVDASDQSTWKYGGYAYV